MPAFGFLIKIVVRFLTAATISGVSNPSIFLVLLHNGNSNVGAKFRQTIKKKFLFFFTLTFVFCTTSKSQQKEIDSLQKALASETSDSSKMTLLNQISEKLWMTGDYEKAMNLVNQALVIDQNLKAPSDHASIKRRADAFIVKALIFWKQGDYPKSLDYYFSSLGLNEQIGNKKGISRCLNNVGLIYFNQGNYDEALKKYLSALKIREQLKDKKNIAGSLNNIGEVYSVKGQYRSALRYFERALAINRELDNKNWATVNINNIGGVYFDIGEQQQHKNEKDSAAINYNLAHKYYEMALRIREETGDKQGVAKSNISLGQVNLELKNFDKAARNFEQALHYARMIGYRDAIKECYRSLSRLDSARGQFNSAFTHYKEFVAYRDSLINEENTKKTVRAEMNFMFEKKEQAAKLEQEKKDAAAAEEKKRQFIITLSVSVVLLVVLVLATVIFRSLRLNQKQNKIIMKQKEIVESQKRIVEEKQKEISDSINYAERIQRSFLASDEILKKNLRDHFVFFQPRDVVSGDFYWAAELDAEQKGNEKVFALATADSTGHGVPGAIMSILNISCLEHSVEEMKYTRPAQILNHTRKRIIDRLKKDGSPEGGKDGMDCSLICFDFKKMNLTYSAANNPVWIVRNSDEGKSEMIELNPDKMPVGKHDRDINSFSEHEVELKPGDMVYAITDGMPDQFGGIKKKKFMYKQLKELLLSVAMLAAEEQRKIISKRFNDWKGEMEQVDDVTVIGVRI